VEVDPLHGEADGAGYRQFPARDHVQAQALLGQEGGEPAPDVGLGRVDDGAIGVAGAEGLAVLAAGCPQLLLVEDVEGRAELLRQVDSVAAAEGQMTVGSDARRARKDGSEGRVKGHGTGPSIGAVGRLYV
jgi:hypothetical protein